MSSVLSRLLMCGIFGLAQGFEEVREPHVPITLRAASSDHVGIRLTKTGPLELLSAELIDTIASGYIFDHVNLSLDETNLAQVTVQPIFEGEILNRLLVM